MPEGPLLIIYKEALLQLAGEEIDTVSTTLRTADLQILEGLRLTGITTWGKYLFLIFDYASDQDAPLGAFLQQSPSVIHVRIHWGMFGIYYLDKPHPDKAPTATLAFSNGRVLYLYSVSLRIGEGVPSDTDYDPRIDVMCEVWDSKLALKNLRAQPHETMVCDALLDQTIFAGLGNAIKTEALFAQSIHPESKLGGLSTKQLKDLIEEAIGQSQLFLEGKRAFGEARYGWVVAYRKKMCPRCGEKMTAASTGILQRKSQWCPVCQKLYA